MLGLSSPEKSWILKVQLLSYTLKNLNPESAIIELYPKKLESWKCNYWVIPQKTWILKVQLLSYTPKNLNPESAIIGLYPKKLLKKMAQSFYTLRYFKKLYYFKISLSVLNTLTNPSLLTNPPF